MKHSLHFHPTPVEYPHSPRPSLHLHLRIHTTNKHLIHYHFTSELGSPATPHRTSTCYLLSSPLKTTDSRPNIPTYSNLGTRGHLQPIIRSYSDSNRASRAFLVVTTLINHNLLISPCPDERLAETVPAPRISPSAGNFMISTCKTEHYRPFVDRPWFIVDL